MIKVDSEFGPLPKVDQTALDEEAAGLAEDMASEYEVNTKSVLSAANKVGSKGSLQGVKSSLAETSSRGRFEAKVVAPETVKRIIEGRAPGRKAPLVFVGTGPRGGKVFQPVPNLLQWILSKGINPIYGVLIALRIARKGIKPVDVQEMAAEASKPGWTSSVQTRVRGIMRRLFRG